MTSTFKMTHEAILVEDGHLGGWTMDIEKGTHYPIMWKYLVNRYQIKTVLDVGCGRGFSTKHFQSLGCDILGVDGSTKAEEIIVIPEHFLLNDYENGAALSNSKIEYNDISIENFTFDLCWSCEFVEHVCEEFSQNFIDDFKRCKHLAMTFAGPGQGGHHHVNCQPEEYWIKKLEDNGFKYLSEDTKILKEMAIKDREDLINLTGDLLFTSHFVHRGLFFENTNV